MKMTELQNKAVVELRMHVTQLRRQAFKLRLLKSTPEFKEKHEIKKVRRQIAQTLTVLAQKVGQAS